MAKRFKGDIDIYLAVMSKSRDGIYEAVPDTCEKQ